jgi:hypothetical protein
MTAEPMTEKQRDYLNSLLTQMKERAIARTTVPDYQVRTSDTGDEYSVQVAVDPTPETDLESYVIRGFWTRATLAAKLTKQGASKYIDLLRDGNPSFVLDYLIEHDKMHIFGEDAKQFVLSMAQ